MDTNRVPILVPELILAGQFARSQGLVLRGRFFCFSRAYPLVTRHGSLRSQSVSCTRKVPVKTQAAGRSQGRMDGHLRHCLRAMLSPRLGRTRTPAGAPSQPLGKTGPLNKHRQSCRPRRSTTTRTADGGMPVCDTDLLHRFFFF